MRLENNIRSLSQCEIEYIEHIDSYMVSLDRPFYDDEKQDAIQTPFVEINQEIGGGLRRKSLITIAGRPSMGKTMMALQWAEYAVRQERSILMFSTQVPAYEIVRKLFAGHSSSDFIDSLMHPECLKDDDWIALIKTVGKLSPIDKQFLIDDSADLTLGSIRGGIEAANQMLGMEKLPDLDMVLIDTYQSVRFEDKSPVPVPDEICRNLRAIAQEFNLVMVVISNVDRDVERRVDRRPLLGDLCVSQGLESMSDLVLMFYRDEIYNPNTLDQGIVECIIRRNRWGKNTSIKMSLRDEPMRICSTMDRTGLDGIPD